MKAIVLLALSVIILSHSYGLSYADSIVTVETDYSSYETGDMILVHGSISDYNESDPFKNFDVTLRVIASNTNIISISQLPLDSDGSYSTSIPVGGPLWSIDGDYTISVSHGTDRSASVTFAFINSESEESIEESIEESVEEEVIEISEEELEKGCGEGTHLEDGVCVLDETVEAEVPVSTGSSPSTGFNSWIYSISFTILIAFAIMIILYLISRASRNKSDD